MKLPSYDIGNGQKNIEYSEFTHNRPQDPAYNPGRPTKVSTHYSKGEAAERKMKKIRHEYMEGELNIGKSEKKVKSRDQMIAIMLSEGRKAEKESKKRER